MMKKIIGILIIIFIMFFGFKAQAHALKFEPDMPQVLDETNLGQTGQVEAANKELPAIVRPNVEYKAVGLRNPFEQPMGIRGDESGASSGAQTEKQLPQLIVQGIIWGGKFPQAIVNNKVVKVGDTLEGVDIVSIDKEGIIVLFAGVEHTLTTSPAMGKRESPGQ